MDKIEKIKTKEELLNSLKSYQQILNKDITEYLNSLIELEFSALREYISESEKKILSGIELYKQIVAYNIYNRAINTLSKYKSVTIVGNNENQENLNVHYNDSKLYTFNYKNLIIREIDKIGSIQLFTKDFSEEQRQKEIERIISKIEYLKREVNPFSPATIQSYNWAFTHKNYIKEQEDLLNMMYNKTNPTDNELALIELSNSINEDFLEDYQIKNADLDELVDRTKPLTDKTYIKSVNNVVVKKQVNYI